MLAVAVDEQNDPKSFFSGKGYTFTVVKDIDGKKAYDVRGIPFTVVIDAEGNIVEKFRGPVSSAQLDTAIQSAL